MAVRLPVVDAENAASTHEGEGDRVVSGRDYAALCILHSDGDVSQIVWCGADALPVDSQGEFRGYSSRVNLYSFNRLAVLYAFRGEAAGSVRHIPREVQVRGGAKSTGTWRVVAIATSHAGAREGVAFDAEALAVQK